LMYDKKDTTNGNPAESFPEPVAHSLKRIHKRTEGAAGKAGARNATPNKAQRAESGTQLRTRHSGRKAERNSNQGARRKRNATPTKALQGKRNATPNKAQRAATSPAVFFCIFNPAALFAPLARPSAALCLSPPGFVPARCASFSVLFRFPCAPWFPYCSASSARLGFRPVPLSARCASFSVLFRFPPAVPRSPSCSAPPLFPPRLPFFCVSCDGATGSGKLSAHALLIHIETTPTLFIRKPL
jgi:hypothetical protein